MGYIKNNASQLGYTLSTEAQQREELGKSHDVNLYKNIENDGGYIHLILHVLYSLFLMYTRWRVTLEYASAELQLIELDMDRHL